MNKKKKITNTTQEVADNPILGIFHSLPGQIEASERKGAQEAVQSTQLPCRGREEYEKLGFKFGESEKDDPLFCEAEMPEGWSKKRTDHAMHNDILDDKGRKRGGFFYKAAFYDRSAFLHSPTTRYAVQSHFYNFNDPRADTDLVFNVLDRDHPVDEKDKVVKTFHVTGLDREGNRNEYYDAMDKLSDEALNWLKANFPDHADPGAYWT